MRAWPRVCSLRTLLQLHSFRERAMARLYLCLSVESGFVSLQGQHGAKELDGVPHWWG